MAQAHVGCKCRIKEVFYEQRQTKSGGKDQLFAERRERVNDFHFGKETAAVFDDMLNRSVPFCGEIQRMTGALIADFATPGGNIYDLGCSTCNTFRAAAHFLTPGIAVRFIGIDSSPI